MPLYIPFLKKDSTKDLIIGILQEHKAQSIKQIKLRLDKLGKKIAYQSVRQSLEELKESEVLLKNNKHYSLNRSWIDNLYSFADLLKQNAKVKVTSNLKTEYAFSSLGELGHFMLNIMDSKNINPPVIAYLHHFLRFQKPHQ